MDFATFVGVLLTIIFTPLIQLIIFYLLPRILAANANTYALAFGFGYAVLVASALFSFILGFALIPIIMRLLKCHKKYFVTQCPECNGDVYHGDMACRKCTHSFSESEISLMKDSLNLK